MDDASTQLREAVSARLTEYANAKWGSVAGLSRALDMADTHLRKYAKGESLPGAAILERLSRLGLSIDWLLTGRGSMLLGPDVMYQREEGEAGRVEESVTVKAGDQTFRFGWPGPADVPQDVLLFAATSLLRHAQAMEELARTKKKDEDEPSE